MRNNVGPSSRDSETIYEKCRFLIKRQWSRLLEMFLIERQWGHLSEMHVPHWETGGEERRVRWENSFEKPREESCVCYQINARYRSSAVDSSSKQEKSTRRASLDNLGAMREVSWTYRAFLELITEDAFKYLIIHKHIKRQREHSGVSCVGLDCAFNMSK